MKTLHLAIIATFMFVLFFTFYMENSQDVHATCGTINGTEECAPPPPILNSIKSHYVPNETIQLVGAFSPNTMIQIDLVDPSDNIKNSVLVQSDSSGSFQSKMVVPNDAVNGTWKINTSGGLNHSTYYITVISKNLQDNQTNPNHSMPVTLTQPPLKQFKSGIAANYVKCKQDLQLVIKSEDGSPACVKPQTAQKLVERGWGWAMQPIDSLKPLLPNRIPGLENDAGIVTLGNQTYYFETPNYTNTAYSNPVQILFHNVVFTLFPPGFKGGLPTGVGCGNITVGELVTGSGSYYWTDAKFSDGTHELLHIFAYSKLSCPVYSIPTYFSNHTNPQTGLTFYDGKMKLLVSADNQTSSALRLYLSTDSTYANPAEAIGVDISLNNTSSTPLILAKSNNWLRNDLSSGPCSNLPFGMAILKGYYNEQNMTDASSLVIYQNIPCPTPASIKSYTFQPLSNKATQECDSLFSCPVLADMKIHLKVDGFMDNNGQHRPFNVGTYTIVAGDEWGHIAIQHFTVVYATPAANLKEG